MTESQVQSEPVELSDEARDDSVITRALLWSFGVLVIGGGIVTAVFFFRPVEEPPPEKNTVVGVAKKRERPPVVVPEFRFTDITRKSGITFVHENGAAGGKLLPETMGGGVAFFDFDNDGDPDLLFTNSRRWDGDARLAGKPATLALYRNDGGKFTDVTPGSGLDISLFGMGIAVGDFDNDGRVDVYITALGANRLFRNIGNGKFTDVTETAGVAGGQTDWSTSAGFFDADNDGDLDLFVCNYLTWSPEFDAQQNFTIDGSQRAYGQPQKFPGSFCRLFRNEGNGRFADVSKKSGIPVEDSKGQPLGKSLGVTFADFNNDGRLDIVVANDTVRNFFFENLGGCRFQEKSEQIGVAYDTKGNPRGAMGIDSGRFRNNNQIGIAIGNFSNEMTALYVSEVGKVLGFSDYAVATGIGPVTRQELTFGLFFFDADLDGRLDLFASNGHLEKDIAKVQSRQRYEQPPQLLWNCGSGFDTEFLPAVEPEQPVRRKDESAAGFQQRVDDWAVATKAFQSRMTGFVRPMVGRGAAFADIDGDGDLDIVIVANGQPARLLRNDTQLGHHWLRVKVVGTKSNRDAIGATVEVTRPDGVTLRQQVMPTRSYQSQVELPVTFGLGKSDRVKSVRVIWPSGKSRELKPAEITLDSQVTVKEPE